MLERYYLRGNIRQLKNVAEQISAIEETRNISAPILAKYLVDEVVSSSPSVMQSAKVEDVNYERELLYQVLFEMRNDIGELKRMVGDMYGRFSSYRNEASAQSGGVTLLPQPVQMPVETYVDTEVVDEQPREMTKADVQREQIVKALRRNGGSRRAAAAELYMSERTLYRKIKELNIEE